MGARSLERLLTHNILVERIGLPNYSQFINANTVIEAPGSYFCDATEGSIVLRIALCSHASCGSTVTIKKIDTTSNKVIVDATNFGGIDSQSVVELLMCSEVLQFQLFQGRLFLV